MTGKILTFYLCGVLCGIDIKYVREIERKIVYTPVPGVAESIVGLVNLCGQVVTLFNIAKLIKFSEDTELTASNAIILKNRPGETDLLGFVIDKAGDVIDVEQVMCEPLPANITNIERRYIPEVVKLKHELLLLIDVKEIFDL